MTTSRQYFNPRRMLTGIFIPKVIAEMDHQYLSMGAKVCYAWLQWEIKDDDDCVSFLVPKLAGAIGVGERQARNYLSELSEKDFIERTETSPGLYTSYRFIYRDEFDRCLRKNCSGPKMSNSVQHISNDGVQHISNGLEMNFQEPDIRVNSASNNRTDIHIGVQNKEENSEGEENSLSDFVEDSGNVNTVAAAPSEDTGNAFRDRLQPDVLPEDFVTNMYNQFPYCKLDKKLTSSREQGPGGACDKLRSAQDRLGERDFQLSFCNYLSQHWGDLDQKRHPLYIYLKNPEKYLLDSTPAPTRRAPRTVAAPMPAPPVIASAAPSVVDEILAAYPDVLSRRFHAAMIAEQCDDPTFTANWKSILERASRMNNERIKEPILWALKEGSDGIPGWQKVKEHRMDAWIEEAPAVPVPCLVQDTPINPVWTEWKRWLYERDEMQTLVCRYKLETRLPAVYEEWMLRRIAANSGDRKNPPFEHIAWLKPQLEPFIAEGCIRRRVPWIDSMRPAAYRGWDEAKLMEVFGHILGPPAPIEPKETV